MNSSMENATVCSNNQRWEKLLFLPLPLVSFFINFILVLTTINRKKLERQKYIYTCVISIALSNVLFIVVHLWIALGGYFGTSFMSEKVWKSLWTFFQALFVSIQFLMCLNIAALLFVVLDSTYFVGRSINRKATEFVKDLRGRADLSGIGKHKWLTSAKRRRAMFLITLAWLVPLVCTVVVTLVWNCVDECIHCVGGTPFGNACNPHSTCSQTWSPVRNQYLCIQVSLWVLEILGLLIPIRSGIRSFRQVMAPPKENEFATVTENQSHHSNKGDENPTMRRVISSVTIINNPIHQREMTRSAPPVIDDDCCSTSSSEGSPYPTPTSSMFDVSFDFEENQKEEHKNNKKNRSTRRRSLFKLHSRITFMIVLSLAFLVCTLPLITSFLLDITKADVHSEAMAYVSSACVYIYTIACPIILLKYLPSLKSSLLTMIRNCSCSKLPRLIKRRNTGSRKRMISKYTTSHRYV